MNILENYDKFIINCFCYCSLFESHLDLPAETIQITNLD